MTSLALAGTLCFGVVFSRTTKKSSHLMQCCHACQGLELEKKKKPCLKHRDIVIFYIFLFLLSLLLKTLSSTEDQLPCSDQALTSCSSVSPPPPGLSVLLIHCRDSTSASQLALY